MDFHPTENACRFLESLQRFDLAKLLSHAEVSVEAAPRFGGTDVTIRAPKPFFEALEALPDHDRKRVGEAATSIFPFMPAPERIKVIPWSIEEVTGATVLLPELIIHREMMVSVSTGGERIQDVDDYYIAREARLKALCSDLGAPYENPHADLWAWFHHWKEHFGSYAARRAYLKQLFQPAVSFAASRGKIIVEERQPTGWERVDRVLAKARGQLDSAVAEEDCQAIGLLCREVLISLAQAVYIAEVHGTLDGVKASPTDANRMLEAYIGKVFPGDSYKEVRAHARASLALALNLQHRRTATRQLAALCVEATSSVSAVIAIISDR
ncbi:hypothetical protein [Aureimonas psammosilenae]|uniref:hypothetical protein n=1 Tax=Aureimonas psammosilenae TaxID=2495496 RepID=UPI0012609AE2|nr:hypothetical protein [Aureimonas psammosilenae]